LVNNAGQHLKKDAIDTSVEEFHALIDTHLLASHELVRACAPGMIAGGHGSILFISSMTAFLGMPKVIAYSAVKSAFTGMVRALAAELSPLGIRVNAIAPGWIESAALRGALEGDPERSVRILSRTPMARFGTPEEIGNAAAFLCSPAAGFITGTVIPVDGGAHMGF
jgi:gluconate 5-dehydrogenase